MNIFKKISYANKAIKIYNYVKEYEKMHDVKEGVALIKEGIEKISACLPDFKNFIEALKENF